MVWLRDSFRTKSINLRQTELLLQIHFTCSIIYGRSLEFLKYSFHRNFVSRVLTCHKRFLHVNQQPRVPNKEFIHNMRRLTVSSNSSDVTFVMIKRGTCEVIHNFMLAFSFLSLQQFLWKRPFSEPVWGCVSLSSSFSSTWIENGVSAIRLATFHVAMKSL